MFNEFKGTRTWSTVRTQRVDVPRVKSPSSLLWRGKLRVPSTSRVYVVLESGLFRKVFKREVG